MSKVSFYQTPFHVREDLNYFEDTFGITWTSIKTKTSRMNDGTSVVWYAALGKGPSEEDIEYLLQYGAQTRRGFVIRINGEHLLGARPYRSWTEFEREADLSKGELGSYQQDRLKDAPNFPGIEQFLPKEKLDWS